MSAYNINIQTDLEVPILDIGFGEPAQNDQIVRDAAERLDEMISLGLISGGPLLKISGPASLPAAFAIAHKLGHLYGVIAVFDPKLLRYVVSISHNPDYPLGTLIV